MVSARKIGKVILWILVILAVSVGIIAGSIWIINHLPANIKAWGAAKTTTQIKADGIVGILTKVILGMETPITYEGLVLFLAIFFILFFALGDILRLFTTFNEVTSYVIAAGLGVVAGVTGVIRGISLIFGITAGIGAVGIMIIILAGIVVAVLVNIGLGTRLQAWAQERRINIEGMKAKAGAGRVKDALSFLKDTGYELTKKPASA